MPQRLLRPTLRQSQRWNQLPWFEQSFYLRLLMLVDDYGRYEAHPLLLANEAFPYGDPEGHAVLPSAILTALNLFVTLDLVTVYQADGKPYLQLTRWKERTRTLSKFPAPSHLCGQMTAACQQPVSTLPADCGQMIASPPSPSPSPSPTTSPPPSPVTHTLLTRISGAYKRPEADAWPYGEQCLLLEVSRRPNALSELDELLAFRLQDGKYFPPSISRLLENWTHVLDRARNQPTAEATPKTSRALQEADRLNRQLDRL